MPQKWLRLYQNTKPKQTRFVANIGGIMGLCMGCSLVTIFEVGHHVLLIFLKTGKKSVSRIQKTIKLTNERTGDMIMRTASRGSRQSRSAQGQGGKVAETRSGPKRPAVEIGGGIFGILWLHWTHFGSLLED